MPQGYLVVEALALCMELHSRPKVSKDCPHHPDQGLIHLSKPGAIVSHFNSLFLSNLLYIHLIDIRSFHLKRYFDGTIHQVPFKDQPFLHLVFLKII